MRMPEYEKQTTFMVCPYCGEVHVFKHVYAKHVLQHQTELETLRREFSESIADLIIVSRVDDPEVEARLKAVLTFLIAGNVDRDLFRAAGYERFEPLFRHRRDAVLEELRPFLDVLLELGRDVLPAVIKEAGPKLTPEGKDILERIRKLEKMRREEMSKVSYVA